MVLDQCSPTATDPETAGRSLLAQPSIHGLIKSGALRVSSARLTKAVVGVLLTLLLTQN